MSGLTPRQKLILTVLGEPGPRPSIRDLCQRLGASNPMSAQNDLSLLYERGFISKDRRLKRLARR
jgi:DNA-binding IclR family transcriptional regulator